jgi:hypothetical protein
VHRILYQKLEGLAMQKKYLEHFGIFIRSWFILPCLEEIKKIRESNGFVEIN